MRKFDQFLLYVLFLIQNSINLNFICLTRRCAITFARGSKDTLMNPYRTRLQ